MVVPARKSDRFTRRRSPTVPSVYFTFGMRLCSRQLTRTDSLSNCWKVPFMRTDEPFRRPDRQTRPSKNLP